MTFRLGVTGATGYIGQAVVRRANAAGFEVTSIGRRAHPDTAAHRDADLLRAPAAELTAGLDAVIHLAAVLSGDRAPQAELDFAEHLARTSRLIFVSSQAASSRAPSAYGRDKAAIEQRVLAHGATVVRPGMVVGGSPGGMFAALLTLVRRLPVLPSLRPQPMLQPVHVDDLAEALLRTATATDLSGRVLCVAGPPVSLDTLLMALATQRLRVARGFIPVPIGLLRWVLALDRRGWLGRFGTAELDSLAQLPRMDAAADLQRLGLTLRPLADAVTRGNPHRRDLLREALQAARWLLRRPPAVAILRRYARVLEARGLAAEDRVPARMTGWRLDLVCRLAEAQRVHAGAFIAAPPAGRLRMLGWLISAGLLEAPHRLQTMFGPRRQGTAWTK